jgi:hypothetical protein
MVNLHYLNRYNKFINTLKDQVVEGYTEKHHIVPRSHGGNNDESNLIRLTTRQHYVAHWLLWKAYKGSMTTAFHYMNGVKRYGKRLNSKTVELLRLEDFERRKGRRHTPEANERNRQKHLGKKLSIEHKKKISQSLKGIFRPTMPEEAKEKMKATKKARHVPKIWMNKNGTQTKVVYEKIDEYLNNGWQKGTSKKHITKEFKDKMRQVNASRGEDTRKKLSINAKNQWNKIKQTGHTGSLKDYKLCL